MFISKTATFTFLISDTEKKPKGVTHKVLECIHKLGDIKDPITGKPVVVDRYREEVRFNPISFLLNDFLHWKTSNTFRL